MVKVTSIFFLTLKECKIFFYLLVYFILIGWKLTARLSEGWSNFTWNIINQSFGYAHNCRVTMLWLIFNFRSPFLPNLSALYVSWKGGWSIISFLALKVVALSRMKCNVTGWSDKKLGDQIWILLGFPVSLLVRTAVSVIVYAFAKQWEWTRVVLDWIASADIERSFLCCDNRLNWLSCMLMRLN